MKVEIMFWKTSSGKWYSGCEVDIPDAELGFPGSEEAARAIVKHQNALMDGWNKGGNYHVTTRELEDGHWWTHLYTANRFVAIEPPNSKPYCHACQITNVFTADGRCVGCNAPQPQLANL